MTRAELAQHIRTTGYGFVEPIEAGTQLTQKEISLLQALRHSATAMAARIEAEDAADKAACAKVYSGEVFSYD